MNRDNWTEEDWAKLERDLEKMEREIDERMRALGIPSEGRRPKHYILNDQGQPVPTTMAKSCVWLERHHEQKIVSQEWIENIRISTIFLWLDHNFGDGPPILWETMTFSNRKNWDQLCDRCAGSREQAEAMHARICAEARATLTAKVK